MMGNRKIKPIKILASFLMPFLILLVSIGCGDNLFQDQSEVKIYPEKGYVKPGNSIQILATGGVKPYRFKILTTETRPDDTISDDGLFTASATEGAAIIRMNDSLGDYKDSIIYVTKHAGETPHVIALYAIGLSPAESVTISNNGSIQITLTEAAALNWFNAAYYENDPYSLAITASPAGKTCEIKGTITGTMPNANLIIPVLCNSGYEIGGHLYKKDARLLSSIDFRTMYTRNFSGGPGVAAFADNADSALARFDEPAGITIIHNDTAKLLFIADRQNARIRMIDLSTPPYAVTTLAGSGVSQSMDGDGIGASFTSPNAISTEGYYLYIADRDAHSIKKIETWGTNKVTTIAGPKDCAGACASGDIDATANAARFNQPSKLVYARNFLYVTDTGNNKIKKINLLDNVVTTIATGYTFNNPIGITADNTYLYVADTGNNKIVRIHLDTEMVDNFAGTGAAGTKDGPITNSMLNAPMDLFYDGHYVYITEINGNAIRRLDPSTGYLATIYKSTAQGTAEGDIFTATFHSATANFDWMSLASDGEQFYMADTHSHLIRTLSSDLVAHYPLYLNVAEPSKARDHSYKENDATINAASIVTGPSYNGKTNASYDFDGTSSYIEGTALNLPKLAEPRTVCAWINIDDYKADGTVQTIFAYDDFTLEVEYLSANPGQMNLITNGANVNLNLPTGIWNHVCATNDGTDSRIYFNGKNMGTSASTPNTNNAGNFQIGRDPVASDYFDGKIADVRVYNRALNNNEVSRLSISIPDELIAYYPLNAIGAIDLFATQNNGNQVGGVGNTSNSFGDVNNARHFDGNDGRINVNSTPQLSGLSQLTLSLWVKFENITTGNNTDYIQTIASKASNGGAPDALSEWYLIYDTPNDQLLFRVVDSTATGSSLVLAGVKDYLHADDWYHIAVTWNSNAMKMYINGLEVASKTTGVPADMQNLGGQSLRFGGSGLFTAQGRPFHGALDDIKIYHRALALEEIQAMARGRGDNLIVRLGNTSGNDLSGSATCALLNAGNPPSVSTNQNGFTNSAYLFDGINDTTYIDTSCNDKLARSFGDEEPFSVCTWVFANSLPKNVGDYYALLDFRDSSGTKFTIGLLKDALGPNIGVFTDGLGTLVKKPFFLPINTWSHICVTYDGGDTAAVSPLKLYLNGQKMADQNVNLLNGSAISYVYLGSKDSSNYFPGKMSDVRIYERSLPQKEIVRLGTQVPSGLVSHLAVVDNPSRKTDFIHSTGTFTEEGTVTPLPTGPDRFGIANSAISLASASSQRLSHGDPTLGAFPEADEHRSLCAWAKGDSLSGQAFLNIASYGTNSNFEALVLEIIEDTTIYRPAAGRIGGFINTQHIFNENTWNHYCITYDGSDMSLYVNAVKHTSQTVALNTTLGLFRIGSNLTGVNGYWDGLIDDVKLYNRVLTTAEMKALSGYHPTQVTGWNANPATSSLRFHISADSLNQADGSNVTSIQDLSGNDYHLSNGAAGPLFSQNQINKKPALIFNGTDYLTVNSVDNNMTGYTNSIFSVFSKNASASNQPLLCQTGTVENITAFIAPDKSFNLKYWNAGYTLGSISNNSIADSSYSILSSIYNNTSGSAGIFQDGSDILNTSAVYTPAGVLTNTLNIGADCTVTTVLDGSIAEIIIYNTELSIVDRQIIECYLSSKYGRPVSYDCP